MAQFEPITAYSTFNVRTCGAKISRVMAANAPPTSGPTHLRGEAAGPRHGKQPIEKGSGQKVGSFNS